MSAEIVHLNQDSPTNVICNQTGLRFPLVYRRVGHLNRVDRTPGRDGNISIYEGEFAVHYTLSPDPVTHFFSQNVRPIKFMDSHLDRGWLLVRHHKNRELASSYLDYDSDIIGCMPNGAVPGQRLFEIEGQYFTLTHRPHLEDAPDRLVAYITKAPRHGYFHEEGDVCTILSADGTQLHPDVLWGD